MLFNWMNWCFATASLHPIRMFSMFSTLDYIGIGVFQCVDPGGRTSDVCVAG